MRGDRSCTLAALFESARWASSNLLAASPIEAFLTVAELVVSSGVWLAARWGRWRSLGRRPLRVGRERTLERALGWESGCTTGGKSEACSLLSAATVVGVSLRPHGWLLLLPPPAAPEGPVQLPPACLPGEEWAEVPRGGLASLARYLSLMTF